MSHLFLVTRYVYFKAAEKNASNLVKIYLMPI